MRQCCFRCQGRDQIIRACNLDFGHTPAARLAMSQDTTAKSGSQTLFSAIFGLDPVTAINHRGQNMPSIAIKPIIIGTLLAFGIATASAAPFAGNKPPRYINDPLIGLRVAATAKLDPVPRELIVMCKRDPQDTTTTAHLWVFASASDGSKTYYLLSGYAEVRKKPADAPLYDAVERGGMYIVADGRCVSDPADEYFEGPPGEVPLPVLRNLASDLAARLVRAVGGPDKLRAEIKNQRIDVDRLPPVLQSAFKPYFTR